MTEKQDETKVVSYAAIRYGAWILGLIIVLYFISRHLFPFFRSLFLRFDAHNLP